MIDLSEQVVNNSINATLLEPRASERDLRQIKTNSREREIVRKGKERAKMQLRQVISNDLDTNSKDISLIKKHKIVDIPAIHAAVGNIQKSLQKYV